MSDESTSRSVVTPGINRRTVMKGAAWSVPVIMVASAAPALAASPGFLTVTGAGCKLPGNSNPTYKGYAFRLVASNTTGATVSISVVSVTLGGVNLGAAAVLDLSGCTLLANPFDVGAGVTTTSLALVTAGAGSSSNGQLIVTYTVDGGPNLTTQTAANAAPPVNGASCSEFDAAEKTCLQSDFTV